MVDVGGIWIQGAGELASGVGLRLARCGYRVIMAEVAQPRFVRRLVCFGEAVYTGRAEVEGIVAERVLPDALTFRDEGIAVVVDPSASRLPDLEPRVVIDARMTKRKPEPLGDQPLIGLGPGFTVGADATYVVETHRQARLGEVIDRGSAASNTGVPGGVVGGETAKRVVRAPRAGRLVPCVSIGDLVEEDEVLGQVEGVDVRSRLAGRVRGLIHPEVELHEGEKAGDVDPRGADIDPRRVTDKALAVAGGVLEALLRLSVLPDRPGRV